LFIAELLVVLAAAAEASSEGLFHLLSRILPLYVFQSRIHLA